jgi:hypothetical protein
MRTWMIPLSLLIGCGGPVTVSVSLDQTKYVPAWAEDAPTLEARTIAAAKVAIEVWGRDEHALEGWDLFLTNSHLEYDSVTGRLLGSADTDWDGGGTIRLDITYTAKLTLPPCIEVTELAHEIGHLAISGHDRYHLDPRWRDPEFSAQMASALVAVVPPDDEECIVYLTTPGKFLLLDPGIYRPHE